MNLIEKILMPYLSWIQLEVSGLCNASCFYCPHTTYRKKWKGRNLSIYEFQKIVPYLKKVNLLYLQGWGEPFCNPDFFKFVEIAKKLGCKVGTTTNGMLIKDKDAEKIVDLQLDIIAFSLTGIKTNDNMREGTKIEKVFKVIEQINEFKIKKSSLKPKINIAYMCIKSNYSEIDEIPEAFHSKGIDTVVVSFLDFIPYETLNEEAILPKTEREFQDLNEKALEIIDKARKYNFSVSFNISHPFKRKSQCSEKPLNTLFISSLGYVSPCVFTGIPIERDENLFFGNINNIPIPFIWRKKEYKEFRKNHCSPNPPNVCKTCPKLRIFNI